MGKLMLCQVAINQDPQNADSGVNLENNCERFCWALHDPNLNVLSIVTQSGRLVERFEHTPCGRRRVYTRPRCHADLEGDGEANGEPGTVDGCVFHMRDGCKTWRGAEPRPRGGGGGCGGGCNGSGRVYCV